MGLPELRGGFGAAKWMLHDGALAVVLCERGLASLMSNESLVYACSSLLFGQRW